MVSHALITFLAIVLAIVFFSIPLILKYHVYKPEFKYIVLGDVVPVSGRLSSTWCQGVDLHSESKFRSFIYESEPVVDERETERTVSTHRITLPNRAQEYWGFHLLKGSSVDVSTCSRLIRADVTVVKGALGLQKCLQEHKKKLHDDEASGEDSLSESESDEDTSSISSSQGVVTNETDAPYICSNSLQHVELPSSYRCKFPFDTAVRSHTLSQQVNDTDYYYFIFSSYTYLDIMPNEFSVVFTFDRTRYDAKSSVGNCSRTNECRLPIAIGSDHKIVVHMEGVNGTLKSEKLQVACRPREWIFMIFYALFLIVIFLCAFQ